MNKNKNYFLYKNKIILINGSSLNITSIKYFKNYQLNFKIFTENKISKNLNPDLKKNKLTFLKKIN